MKAGVESIDLNLLIVFKHIFECRSVSKAADRLGRSQSVMSYDLAKLRRHFGDPLFTKTASGMQPTKLAAELAGPIADALGILESRVVGRERFDPATSTRVFNLQMSDIAELNFLPRLIDVFAREAPGIRIKTLDVGRNEAEGALMAGAIDLLIGYFPSLRAAGIYQQRLFEHSYACIARRGHPRVGNRIGLKALATEQHVVVKPEGRSVDAVDEALRQHGLSRSALIVTPHYMAVPFIVGGSDLISIVPVSMAEAFERGAGDIRRVALPFPSPRYLVRQHWHERSHDDPGCRWLRATIAAVFGSARSGAKPVLST